MVECLCSSCRAKYISEIEGCLGEEVELEGGICHSIEEFEELRLTLKSFLKKDVLNSLLELSKELDKEPKHMEMYAWFVRNSQYGGECRYAQGALNRFKEKRLDRIEKLLYSCIEQIEKMKNE